MKHRTNIKGPLASMLTGVVFQWIQGMSMDRTGLLVKEVNKYGTHCFSFSRRKWRASSALITLVSDGMPPFFSQMHTSFGIIWLAALYSQARVFPHTDCIGTKTMWVECCLQPGTWATQYPALQPLSYRPHAVQAGPLFTLPMTGSLAAMTEWRAQSHPLPCQGRG